MVDEQPKTAGTRLDGHKYMNLVTFRKTGQTVNTPVWFARDDDRVFVMTVNPSGKVKRIRNNGRAMVGPSDAGGRPLGTMTPARARVLSAGESQHARTLLNRKYGWQKRMFDLFMKLVRREQVYLEIVPDNA